MNFKPSTLSIKFAYNLEAVGATKFRNSDLVVALIVVVSCVLGQARLPYCVKQTESALKFPSFIACIIKIHFQKIIVACCIDIINRIQTSKVCTMDETCHRFANEHVQQNFGPSTLVVSHYCSLYKMNYKISNDLILFLEHQTCLVKY